ncbi:MAG: hypothetical protein PHX38_02930 [Sulfuricella sp.]|nr:hypothetical protein [Sulfuricella sp.]
MAMKIYRNSLALALLMGSVLALPACGKKEETPPAPKVGAGMNNLQQVAVAAESGGGERGRVGANLFARLT